MSQPSQPYTLHTLRPPAQSLVASAKERSLHPDFAPASQATTSSDLFLHALYIRKRVFVDEQHCSLENEVDAEDSSSFHFVLSATLSPEATEQIPAGTARLVQASAHSSVSAGEDEGERPLAKEEGRPDAPNMDGSAVWDGEELYAKIGRFATLAEFRGKGYGRVVVDAAVEYARAHPKDMVQGGGDDGAEGKWKGLICAHAQENVVAMYERLGFELDEGMGRWWEEGIEHVGVWKRVEIESLRDG